MFIENLFHPVYNLFGLDGGETGIVTPMARTVAVNTAGATVETIVLNGVLLRLVKSHEAGKGVRSSPDAHHGGGSQRSQVHIGRVHGNHDIQMAHEYQFLMQVL